MSKKQLHNRLEALFSEFGSLVEPILASPVETPAGWWWECDGSQHYTLCGEEVFECLGIPASRFHGQLITHFAVAAQSIQPLIRVFEQNLFPVELDVFFQSPEGAFVPVRLSIHLRPHMNGGKPGWRGYAQVISSTDDRQTETSTGDVVPKPGKPKPEKNTAPEDEQPRLRYGPTSHPSMVDEQFFGTVPVWQSSNQGAIIQMPVDLHRQGKGHIEIIDEHPDRAWTEDDRLLIQEVAKQLSNAIESAQALELTQKAYEEMRQADHMKSQFLANMSHELRTPLNSIIGFSRVILKGIDGEINDVQHQDLTSIYNSGQHLLGLINDVLDLSKIEAGKMELLFDEVNLIDLINSVMSTAIGLVKDKPIKLQTILPDSLPIVMADNTRVRQVLLNFLSNAAKFTDEGTITVKAIETTGPDNQPELLVTVTDTGPGIAEEDRDKLFVPFSQVDDSPTRKTGGTGLGLSICRSFMEMHKGRIGLLWSEVGKGSTFFFSLPMSRKTEGQSSEELPDTNTLLTE